MVAGAEDVHQSLQILLTTGLGERVMREDFGCDLDDFLFEELDQGLINAVSRQVSDAVVLHEPRIELEEVEVTERQAGGGGVLLLVQLRYRIRSTNSRYNLVYPFYLQEAATEAL